MNPVVVKSFIDEQGFRIHATGIAHDLATATAKARAELVERVYTSDLHNHDTTGLFTYKTPPKWCSTGAAAHPVRDIAVHKSTAELVERDSVACWLSISAPTEFVTEQNGISVYRIPCAFSGWYVCVAIKDQGSLRQLTGAAAQTLVEAANAAFLESYVRLDLPREFVASRLPDTVMGSVPVGTFGLPDTITRFWEVEDLHVVKQFSGDLADFRRGIPAISLSRYVKTLGVSTWHARQLQRNWYC